MHRLTEKAANVSYTACDWAINCEVCHVRFPLLCPIEVDLSHASQGRYHAHHHPATLRAAVPLH
jgi:hypothetical protein